MKTKVSFIGCLVALMLCGCVQVPVTYQPALENLEVLKGGKMPPLNVGVFALAPGKDAAIDKSVTARAATIVPANGGTFSQFLKEAITTELRTAGKYDSASTIVIRGLLTTSQLDAAIGTGSGALGAKFSLSRGDRVVYEKDVNVDSKWESSFVGATAIPAAINEYTSLYKKLIGKLFGDSEFRAAVEGK